MAALIRFIIFIPVDRLKNSIHPPVEIPTLEYVLGDDLLLSRKAVIDAATAAATLSAIWGADPCVFFLAGKPASLKTGLFLSNLTMFPHFSSKMF